MPSPGEFIRKCERRRRVLEEIMDGLTAARGHYNNRMYWGDAERRAKMRLLEDIGIRLVTRTAIARHGHRLKRGARPIGVVYFGAPLQQLAEVFILGVQTEPLMAGA